MFILDWLDENLDVMAPIGAFAGLAVAIVIAIVTTVQKGVLLFDIITKPFQVLFDWIGYFFIFGATIITILTLGAVIAIPFGLKMLGVAFAKTMVIETGKIVRDLNIDKITVDTKAIKNQLEWGQSVQNKTNQRAQRFYQNNKIS